MKTLQIITTKVLLIVVVLGLLRCNPQPENKISIEYPSPLPDSGALDFLPGIVNSDSLDFNAAFSPDGKKFYFSRSQKGKWVIYVTEKTESSWTNPVLAPFHEPEYSQADPFFANDGTMYYISNRPRNAMDTVADYDIWFIREKNGAWTEPENLAIVNSDSTEYYVSVAGNGNLYFASNRQGTAGSHDIYVSRFVDGAYSTPENLGSAINSTLMEHDPMVSADEQFLIFTSVDRADSHGSADLYYSLRNDDGAWAPAKNLGDRFNTDTYEYCSYLTPDGKYFFYSTDYNVKWISTRLFPWMNP